MNAIEQAVWDALRTVMDPELPTVSIVDLGMVGGVDVLDDGRAVVRLVPTFLGCPAFALIKERVAACLGERCAEVQVDHTVVWSPARISAQGAAALKAWGIGEASERPPCPRCGSSDVIRHSAFGPSLCRAIFYCNRCQEPFEAIKPV
jgi:ring-1,2-phenylacetyl-CoA epoxidase subunit PaaD